MMTCECGCGKSIFRGRRFAHDCPTREAKQRASWQRKSDRRSERRKAKRLADGRPVYVTSEPFDISAAEIERRFQVALADQRQQRKRAKAA